MEEEEDYIDNKYIKIKTLGEGSFGKVYLVKTKDTNKEFAVKVLLKENKNFEIKIKIINIISSLKSKYIINLIDYGKGPIPGNGENQYVVYEYASKGTLFDYFLFPNESSLEEKYAKILFKKILKGIQDMHNIKICHRDIKLENILLDENFNPKICDFGFVIPVSEERKLKSKCGTRGYTAPEIFKNVGGYDGIKADIFSLGITLLRLVTGKQEKDLVEKMKKVIEENKFEEYNKILKIRIKDTSPEFQSLIVKMIDFDPEKRPIIDTLLNDPWFSEVKDDDLNQQQDYIKEFQKREEIINNKEDSIESSETNSIECPNSNRALDDEDYEYFKNEYNMKIINENKKNIKDYIKIIGNIRNPRKFMNSIANKIKKDNKNYKIVASNKKYKFYVNLEYEIDEAQDEFENKIKDMKDEDEYIDFEYNGLIKKDLKFTIQLLLTINNNYLIRFYKKSGDLEEYYEKLDRIKSLIKSQ